jgi:excisionase family DNA binding protein
MPSPQTPSTHSSEGRRAGARARVRTRAAGPTEALFVRIPTEHARRLDRAAFELRVPKQSLVSELVDRYVDPDSPQSLAALHRLGSHNAREGTRRVTVETLDGGELTVGHHSFRPRDPEVLTPQEAAELLQVDADVVLDLARAGELPGRELAGHWRFARAALLRWLGAGNPGDVPAEDEQARAGRASTDEDARSVARTGDDKG